MKLLNLLLLLAWRVTQTNCYWFSPAPKIINGRPSSTTNNSEDLPPARFHDKNDDTNPPLNLLTKFRVVARYRIDDILSKLKAKSQNTQNVCEAYFQNRTSVFNAWGANVIDNCKVACKTNVDNLIHTYTTTANGLFASTNPPLIRAEVLRIVYILTSLDAFHAIYTDRPARDDLSKRNTGLVT